MAARLQTPLDTSTSVPVPVAFGLGTAGLVLVAIAVVLADHGELFGEHALFGHSNTLYEPLIRVPMVMAGPALPKGLVVQEVVSLVDVMPTLLAMAGVEAPEVDGRDLRPVIAARDSTIT